MSTTDALRFLHYQSLECRTRDAHEALCLLIPGLMHTLELEPMKGYEAEAFRKELRNRLEKISTTKIHATIR